jgi:2-polyprenyl-3-methyl-5-hydroxy-6-metoxy-1,4-benzoquinol methylase
MTTRVSATSAPDHEATYRRANIAGIIHRNRLRAIIQLFRRHISPDTASWADFGCSNGYVIQQILDLKEYSFRRVVGFDAVPELVENARSRGIRDAEFRVFNLNTVEAAPEKFALVTCMETVEHVGNVENALANLVAHVESGGLLLITAPNEIGWPGLTKFFARLALRRNAYGDFFARHSRADYVKRLLTGAPISPFRQPPRHGWGPHLGFDYRVMEAKIDERYIQPGTLALVTKERPSLGMNHIYLYRRLR